MTKKEIEKITEYLRIKGSFNRQFKGYALLYSMTTENICGFLNRHSVKDKKVLTVAGSGDQRYNCYLKGAKEVTCFDVNPLAELHLKLKDTAMEELDYIDFIKFFGINTNEGNYFLDPNIFRKISNYLDKDVYLFYDYIINKFTRNPLGGAYHDFDYKYSKMQEFSEYITKGNYERLVDTIRDKDINFMNVNVTNLPEVLDGEKFDMILLSNISDYIQLFYSDNHMQRYKELVDKLVDNLYDGGIIQIGYIYSRYDDHVDNSKFSIDKSRNKVFPVLSYPVEFVHSFYGDGTYDKIVTYQKKSVDK